ncbi:MAG TPA: type III ribulose-bisphosphate carboxylase, partial [Candidatus Altiarchaeales archaeon]|nr:type III ribulose-bisphosphate carboxylase [Candidatus Altiarchaeales archaeon]
NMDRDKLKPHAFDLDEKNGLVKIAYPNILFELDNIPQILSSVAGNIYGMKSLQNLRVLDIHFPKKMVKAYEGPEFGIVGVRKVLGVQDRPLVGTIVKPKVGLKTREHAKVAYDAWTGGCDIVKDDENLTSQKFNPFEERVVETLAARDKAESETGEKKVYMANITAEVDVMLERLDYIRSNGGRYAMIDVVTLGFSAVQTVRKHNKGLVLHAHRAMHGALTRNKKMGITMLTLAKLYRLCGVDQLHVGTAVGKMEGGKKKVSNIADSIVKDKVDEEEDVLSQKWFGMKPVFPVASGGMHPGLVSELMEFMGKDVIIQAGGGIHGHPEGTRIGATAMRQAVDATLKGITLEEYSKTHKELSGAVKLWGRK